MTLSKTIQTFGKDTFFFFFQSQSLLYKDLELFDNDCELK